MSNLNGLSMHGETPFIVIGTSAGGLQALRVILGGIHKDINAAIFVVQHMSPNGPGLLPTILQSVSALKIAHAIDQEPIRRGRVYVAPPNRHLVIAGEQVLTTNGPRENYSRPAIDPLFRSAALAHGSGVIAVILTGRLDDGSAGLWAVKESGGIAIVQDPQEAEFDEMPRNALATVHVDHCLPLIEIGPLLSRLAQESPPEIGASSMANDLELETRIAKEESVSKRELLRLAEPSVFTCPECHGALLQLKRSGIMRFRCHTGHAFSVQTLLSEINSQVESNLWTAIRSMEERVLLLDHLTKHPQATAKDAPLMHQLRQTARTSERQAATVREVVMQNEPLLIDQFNKEDQQQQNSSRERTAS